MHIIFFNEYSSNTHSKDGWMDGRTEIRKARKIDKQTDRHTLNCDLVIVVKSKNDLSAELYYFIYNLSYIFLRIH